MPGIVQHVLIHYLQFNPIATAKSESKQRGCSLDVHGNHILPRNRIVQLDVRHARWLHFYGLKVIFTLCPGTGPICGARDSLTESSPLVHGWTREEGGGGGRRDEGEGRKDTGRNTYTQTCETNNFANITDKKPS